MAIEKIKILGAVFIHLQGLGSSQLTDHLVNEINQSPCFVKLLVTGLHLPSYDTRISNGPALSFSKSRDFCHEKNSV